MPKYLLQVSYTTEGVKGLLKEGGTSRRAAVETLAAGLGGTIEAFYYAFGADDVVVIAEMPDDETAAAVSLTIAATGAVHIRSTRLLTPEQIDTAAGIAVSYRAPGA